MCFKALLICFHNFVFSPFSFVDFNLKGIFNFIFYLAGEGNEEISNMIHSYIKEIEDLRYGSCSAIYSACFGFCSVVILLFVGLIV